MKNFNKLVCVAIAMSALLLWVGCTPGTGGGQAGDMASGDDGAVGGISEVPNPTETMAKLSGKPLSQLQRGHEVYMLKCGECHQYQLPEHVDIMDWEDAMPKMIGHAGLPNSDEKAVLDYVVAVKKQKGQKF
jgi:cytochrome c5